MAPLDVSTVGTYEEFVQVWGADADRDLAPDDEETRLLWQLLGQLNPDEVLVRIPEWLAEAKAGYTNGAPPTMIVGRIERETDQAIRLADSAAARPLMKLAHRIHRLEHTEADADRNEWLDDRLATHRRAFHEREDVPGLAEEWLPKSQLQRVVRREE